MIQRRDITLLKAKVALFSVALQNFSAKLNHGVPLNLVEF